MDKRYYVETSDEYGPTEYDRFDTPEEAIAFARQLVESFPYAVAVDGDNYLVLAKFGNLPADWR